MTDFCRKYEPLEQFFSSLPPIKTRLYEVQIAKCANYCSANGKHADLLEIIGSDSPVAFEAFFCLCTVYRRNKDYLLLHELIEANSRFKTHPLFNHILVQYLVHSEAFYDYDALLKLAYDDALAFKDNAGFLQSFCNAFVTICETCNHGDIPRIVKNWYDAALRCINRAIEASPEYAKFYVTKARIISLKHQYDEADSLMKEAISKEDSSRHDYALTIDNYQNYRQRFLFDKKLSALESRITELEAFKAKFMQDCTDGTAGIDAAFELVAYDGNAPYAFISYAHKDEPDVYAVLRALQKRGIRFWFDKGIEPGAEWPEEVAEHLANSNTILVMLSPSALGSANVRREVNLALSENKNIIVVQLDDVEMTLGMKMQFGLYQMIVKNHYTENQFISLLAGSLAKELGT